MTTTDRLINELSKAGFFDKDSAYGVMIGEAVKELLLCFQKQGHSGTSAKITAAVFHELIEGKPLSPLTEDPSEWMEVSDGLLQNNRATNVFINKKESTDPYTLDGKAFSDDGGKTWFTSKDSRVFFKLPGFPPKTEYVVLQDKT